ncbi:uncharacterized protein LOC143024570 [Oratosquilla oratoria]|uniref:uncharacterized protein LOC143024570 n=1 Tax=Oratosquilla oratoria TaxID=337810 RepID=UPI003F7648AF
MLPLFSATLLGLEALEQDSAVPQSSAQQLYVNVVGDSVIPYPQGAEGAGTSIVCFHVKSSIAFHNGESEDMCTYFYIKHGIIDVKEAINELGSQFLRLVLLAFRHEDVSDFLSHLDKDLKLLLDFFDGNVLHATNVAVQAGITLIEENHLDASIQSHVISNLANSVFQDYLPKVKQTSEVDQWYAVLLGSLWLRESKKKAKKKVKKIISQVLPLSTLCRVRTQGPDEDFKTQAAEVLIKMDLEELKRLVPEALQSLDVECTDMKRKKWEKGSKEVLESIKADLVTAVDTLSVITKQFQEKLVKENTDINGKPSRTSSKNDRSTITQRNLEMKNEENVKEVGDGSSKKVDHIVKHEYEMKARLEQVTNSAVCTDGKKGKKKMEKHNKKSILNSERTTTESVSGNECTKTLQKTRGSSSQINPDGDQSKLKPGTNIYYSLGKSLNTFRIQKYGHRDRSFRSTTSSACEEEKNRERSQGGSSLAKDQLANVKASKNKGTVKQVSFLLDPIGASFENCELEFLEPSQHSNRRPRSQDKPLGKKITESKCVELGNDQSATRESLQSIAFTSDNKPQPVDTQNQEITPVGNEEKDSYVIPGGFDATKCSSKKQQKKCPLHSKKNGKKKIEEALETHLNNLIHSLQSDSDFENDFEMTTKYKKTKTGSRQMQGKNAVNPQRSKDCHDNTKRSGKQETSNKMSKQIDKRNGGADNLNIDTDKQRKHSRTSKHIIDNNLITPSSSKVKNNSSSKVSVKRIGAIVKRDVTEPVIGNQNTEFENKRSIAQKDYKGSLKVLTQSESQERFEKASEKLPSVCLSESVVEHLVSGKAVEDNEGVPEGWRRIVQPRHYHGKGKRGFKVDVKVCSQCEQ